MGKTSGSCERNAREPIPVLKTDFGTWWEDGAASSALETALCRRAEERAVTAEMLHSLTSVLGGADYPKAELDELWRNILLYDEHTWGARDSITRPKGEQAVKQWAFKRSFAVRADEDSGRLLRAGMDKLANLAPSADLLVFNSLSWARRGLVVTPGLEAVRDAATGEVLPCQPLPEGGTCFVAPELPSVGYRTYGKAVPERPAKDAVTLSPSGMENEFYRVTLDARTGAISSVLDKETGRELVDSGCEYHLGELVYASGGEGTHAVQSNLHMPAPKFVYHRPVSSAVKQSNGPVFGELTSEATSEPFGKITLRARLYHGLKRLDLSYELDKRETTAKEAVYIAFPFAIETDKGGLWIEYPGAITEPLKDQHGSACRDWYSVQRWLAASDGQSTVVLSPLDTPLVTLGGMTASTWPRQLSLKRAHVYAYVMNNYWFTNYKAQQGGRQVFRFSLTSNAGPFRKAQAVAQGWEMFCPAVAQPGAGTPGGKPVLREPAKELVGVQPAHLPLLALKRGERDGSFVFRFCDFSGEGGNLKLRLPKVAGEAFTCDLVESVLQPAAVQADTVSVPARPFGPLTVGVKFGP